MRILAVSTLCTLLAACGTVVSSTDGGPGGDPIDARPGDVDGAMAPVDATAIDAPPPPVDAPPVPIDAPAPGPTPVLHWTLDGNVTNSGALTGYALTIPAGVSYVAGKAGQGASFGGGQYAYVDGMRASLDSYAKVTIGFWLKENGALAGQAFLDCNNRATSPYGGVQLGATSSSISVCVATTSNSYLSGGCNGFTAPSANTWHHWIVRYDGAGTGAGQGGPTAIYIDDVLVHTRANDGANDPVFTTTGAPDRLYLGTPNSQLDDVRVYNQVFSPADQCTYVVGGAWNGSSCQLP